MINKFKINNNNIRKILIAEFFEMIGIKIRFSKIDHCETIAAFANHENSYVLSFDNKFEEFSDR